MNYRLERIRSWPERLREMGDRLTRGGVRALLQRLFQRVRHTGDRLTGGGLRSLSRRMATKSLRIAMNQPFLKAVGRSVLQPFPGLSERLYRLATAPSTVDLKSTSLPQLSDHSAMVNSLYRTAFGRLPDEGCLVSCERELRSGTSVEVLAEHLVRSAEFQLRQGPSQEVDINYITALYRAGLGRPPTLERLGFWLTEGEKGATPANVLAGVARSDEALAKTVLATPEPAMEYSRWVAAFDTISDADRAVIRAHIAGLPFRPVISVIMWIATTSEAALRDSFNSVVKQLYPYWELCITVDAVLEPLVTTILRERRVPDLRIRMTRLSTLESIAVATNAALSSATGEFVAFLRAGDVLPEHAIYEVVFALGENGRLDIVYTDHDRMDVDKQRLSPRFKPGWDPDLLLAEDYFSDLVIYRRTLVEAVGWLRPEFEGAEFHDLALRTTTALAPDRIRHVPAILYHRREENPTNDSENSLYGLSAITASHRAVREHLNSTGNAEAILEPAAQMPRAIHVVWPLPKKPPLVSVIIPTRDRADLLARCLEGVLHRTDYSNLEVLIVDNGSIEPATLKLFDRLIREESRVRILSHPGPFNYSAMNNAAAREGKGEVLLLLNNDVDVIKSGWLRELVSHAIRPDVGIVGAKLIYANQLVQHGGVVLGLDDAFHVHRFAGMNDPGYCGQLALPRTLAAVTGACAAIRRAVFFEVGALDEVNLPVTYNDIDLCLRAGDYGYRVVWTPFAELFHLECASRGEDGVDPAKRERALREIDYFRKTWGALLNSADPFHNPNLLFSWGRFEVPASPRRKKPWRDLGEQALDLRRHFSFGKDSASRTSPLS